MTRLMSLLGVFLLGGLLTACGGSGASDSGTASSAERANAAPDAAAVQPADVAKAAAAAPATTVTRLVRTAEITVEVKEVGAAARSVRTTAIALGGVVSSENTSSPAEDEDGADQRSDLTLRIPEPKMDDALSKIATVGREVDRSTTSEDVTATIVDLDSRVATQTKSVARVRELLDQANSLQDVVLLESELSRREADLESIQARQRALVDKAALSTINVTLRSPGTVSESEEAGFLSGLDSGWSALKTSTTVVLTALGAVLPIAVVVAVIGTPIYALRRRFPARRPVAASVPPDGPAPDPVP